MQCLTLNPNFTQEVLEPQTINAGFKQESKKQEWIKKNTLKILIKLKKK